MHVPPARDLQEFSLIFETCGCSRRVSNQHTASLMIGSDSDSTYTEFGRRVARQICYTDKPELRVCIGTKMVQDRG